MSSLYDWLERLGLGKYAALFEDNDVDLGLLLRLSEADLRELGLPLGARKKILEAAATPPDPITAQGRSAIEPVSSEVTPERRQISVVFSDVVGSTALAGQLDVEDLRSLVVAYQRICAEAIESHGGHVAQYLGDGVMAYFGYPQAHEDDAVRAVKAGRAMLETMKAHNDRARATRGVPVEIRVGVHSGLVVAGKVGAGASAEELAIGETPNIAARLQAVARPGELLVSDATWRLIEGFFAAEPLGPQLLKGVDRPTTAYRVVGETGVANAFEARATRFLTPLVSRDVELRFLEERWEQVSDGEGQVVVLQGEAGIGKSRLVRGFRERIGEANDHAVTLYCTSQHQTSAFYPVIGYLTRALAFGKEDGGAARRDKIYRFVETLGLGADEVGLPLATLLAIGPDAPASTSATDPTQLRRSILHGLVRIFVAQSRHRPLLLAVEDVHWIDPSTQDLLGRVVDAIADHRAMVLLTARPEFRAPWAGLPHVRLLSLGRLSRRETEAMIRRVSRTELPAGVLAQLVAKTDGIPLFIEELTRAVGDTAHDRSTAVDVPATLHEALTARIDRLGRARELLQAAGLVGRTFDVDVLQRVVGLSDDQLDRSLADLTESGLVYRHQQARTFEFKHALIQDVAVSTLVRERRALLHGRIAETMQQLRPEVVQQQPEIVAHHLEAAGNDAHAWALWRNAGELAAARSASPEAVKHFTCAADAVTRLDPGIVSPDERAAVWLGLLLALMHAEGYRSDRLTRVLHEAQRAALAAESAPLQWRVALAMSPVFYGTGRNLEYLAVVDELERRAPLPRGDLASRASLHMTCGIAHLHRGEFADAKAQLRGAVELLSQLPAGTRVPTGGGDLAVVVYNYMARTLTRLGEVDDAFDAALEAERIARSIDDRFSLALALMARSGCHLMIGESDAALAEAEEIVAICRRLGVSARLGLGLIRRGGARYARGDVAAAIDDYREGIRLWRGPGVVFHTVEFVAELAEILIATGEIAAARELLDDVGRLIDGTDQGDCLSEWQRLRGVIAANDTDPGTALRWLERATETARHQQARIFELRSTVALARVLTAMGRGAEASRRLSAAHETLSMHPRLRDVREAQSVLRRLQ